MNSGREGVFYDPTNTVRHFLPEELINSLIHGKGNLSKWMDSAMVRRKWNHAPSELIDPLEQFAGFIIDSNN